MNRHESFSEEPAENKVEADKTGIYTEMCEGVPDAIFVLSANIVENKATGEYKSGSYGDPDPHGLLGGGKARAIAGAELHEYFPNAKMVAITTLPARGDIPKQPIAEVTAKELKEFGVNPESIIMYEDSYSTLTELMGLIKLAAENNWSHVVIISNETQGKRTMGLLNNIETIKDNNDSYKKAWDDSGVADVLEHYKELQPKVTFVAAEAILPVRDAHYKKVIEAVRETELYHKRVAAEAKSEEQIANGTYGRPANLPPTFIEHPKE